ncbi:MAG: 2-oxoacid:acceptor oxidoreductase subunit alpha [Candidatus Aenigmarchaeota archaeon]|nr:2-oxoacid:acceptor oxidoreductase subunit alpha [Candidatus Aenigmarchaeota archaeon]
MADKTLNDFSWKVAGEAGHGILNAGLSMFAKTCLRSGLYVYATAEYPSLIRGGHNNLDVRVSDKPIESQNKHIDMLVALDKASVEKHAGKLSQGGAVIYDGEKITLDRSGIRDDVKLYSVPLSLIAESSGGQIMRNTVAIGAAMALLNFDLSVLEGVLTESFRKKGDDIIQGNIKAARDGHAYVKKNFADDFGHMLKGHGKHNKMFLSGHDALAAGAIKAGCKFYAAYPMTPASSLLGSMAASEGRYNLVVKQTEDEIAAINMAIGAGYAGVRSMVGTSGGGFSLMVEGFGLAAMTETPLVIVESQRPGPATGMATHTGQADLRFMLHASTDEFERVIIAPGDVQQCFYETIKAFNLADKYQMPIVIMTDKYLGESYFTADEFETKDVKIDRGKMLTDSELAGMTEYRRYKVTEDAVAPRSIPGQKNGCFVATSYEHDEAGFEREEEEIRVTMHNKRFRKFALASKELVNPGHLGDANADIMIIGWGSTKGPILEAMKLLKAKGIKVAYQQVLYLSPFPASLIKETIAKAKRVVIIENNKMSQLNSVIREHCLVSVDNKILRYDGRPFSPQDIEDGVLKIVRSTAPRVLEYATFGIVNEVKA